MRLFKSNKREFLVAALTVAAALVGYLTFAHPRIGKADNSRQQIRALDQAIQQSSLVVDEMTSLFNMASDLDDFVVQSDDEILPELLGSISSKGEEHGVEIVSMKPRIMERSSSSRHPHRRHPYPWQSEREWSPSNRRHPFESHISHDSR